MNMFDENIITGPDLILWLALSATVVAAVVAYFVNSVLQWRKQQEQLVSSLQDNISALCKGSVKLGEHLVNFEQKVVGVKKRQDEFELRDPVLQPYEHAVRLAANGADSKKIMADCNVVQGEADLIVKMRHYGQSY